MILQLLLSLDAVLLKFFSRLVFTPPYIYLWALCSVVPAHDAKWDFTRLFYSHIFEPLMCFLACFSSPTYGSSLARSRWILSHHRNVLLELFSPLLKMKLSLAVVRLLCFTFHFIHTAVHFRKQINYKATSPSDSHMRASRGPPRTQELEIEISTRLVPSRWRVRGLLIYYYIIYFW